MGDDNKDETTSTQEEKQSAQSDDLVKIDKTDENIDPSQGSIPQITRVETDHPNPKVADNPTRFGDGCVIDPTVDHNSTQSESWLTNDSEINMMSSSNTGGSSCSEFSKPTQSTERASSPNDGASSLKKTTLFVSNWMGENLLVVRYGLIASIGLLTAYGISQSPLMFRYRKVSEIPADYFMARRTLHCRLVKAETISKRTTLYCRHLSLSERLLSMQWNMAASSSRSDTSNCLVMRIVGIEAPDTDPVSESEASNKQSTRKDPSLLQYISTEQLEQIEAPSQSFLHELAAKNILISCKLMARGVTETSNPKKRPIPGFAPSTIDDEQLAFGTAWYRPKGPFQIFASDLGLQLVERGEAIVSTDLYGPHSGMKIVDADSRTNLRKDANYISKTLADAEQSACRKARGVWKDELYRRQRQDFVDDVEFWERASWPRKLWRRIRGG